MSNSIEAELMAKLATPISSLPLSVRALNCLETAGIHHVGELVGMTPNNLLEIRNFGENTLREVESHLADMGLTLGMNPSRTARELMPTWTTLTPSIVEGLRHRPSDPQYQAAVRQLQRMAMLLDAHVDRDTVGPTAIPLRFVEVENAARG